MDITKKALAVLGTAVVFSQVPNFTDMVADTVSGRPQDDFGQAAVAQFAAADRLETLANGMTLPPLLEPTQSSKILVEMAQTSCDRKNSPATRSACLTQAANDLYKSAASNFYINDLPDTRAYLWGALGGTVAGVVVGALAVASSIRKQREASQKTLPSL
jgi:hypothetical protein